MKKAQLSDFTNKVHEINRENILTLLGGQRALLMQVAHPLVGQGVLDHSSVRVDPLRRLQRTVTLFQTLIFGTQEEIDAVAEKINRAHKFVKGNLNQTTGTHQAGISYSAHDPQLLLWVWATLVDTHIVVFDKFIRHLSETEKETYYQQSKKILPPLGGRIEDTPRTYKNFASYMQAMYKSGNVQVSEEIKKEMK